MSVLTFRHPLLLVRLVFFSALAVPVIALAQSDSDSAATSPMYVACQQKLGTPSNAQLNDPDFSRSYNKKLVVCLLSSGGGTVENEYVDRTRVSQDVEPLGQTPFGEHIGLYSGSLSFEQVDIDAPGNGLPIRLTRHYTIPGGYGTAAFSDHFASNGMIDWQMELPHIETLSGARNNGFGDWFFIDDSDRCTGLTAAPELSRTRSGSDTFRWRPEEWWHGFQLVMPGTGSQDVIDRDSGNNLTPTARIVDGQNVSFPYTTKSLWAIGCLNSTSNSTLGEGFIVVSPDGTQYWLDHLAAYPAASLVLGNPPHVLERKWGMMLVSKIKDRFGNTLTYSYTAGTDRVASITASDGRSLSLVWQVWPNKASYYRIASATLHASDAPDRTWTYTYDDVGHPTTAPYLKTVTRPDGSSWQFHLDGLVLNSPSINSLMYSIHCKMGSTDTYHGVQGSGTITHPSGLVGSFTDELITRGRSYVPYDCNYPIGMGSNESNPPHPPLYSTRAITQKAFSGGGIPSRTWSYSYSDPNACYTSYDHVCNAGSPTTVWTEVTDPGGHTTRSTFSNRYDASESLLQSVAVHTAGPTSSVVRSETHGYAYSGAWPSTLGGNFQQWINQAQTTQLAPQNLRQIVQNGNTYTWQAVGSGTHAAFNEYAQVTRTSRDNNADSQASLLERDTYKNDTASWVLGLPEDHINESANPDETVSHNLYNAGTDTLSQRYSFGRKLMDYTWFTNGLLNSFTDANNHTTQLSNYKRGIPRTIQYTDASQKSLVVDDLGQIKSVTDETSDTTSYQYDTMGRVTYVGYPYDTGGWDPRHVSYTYVSSSERGITGTHWKRSVSEGDMILPLNFGHPVKQHGTARTQLD